MYDSTDSNIIAVKEELYAQLDLHDIKSYHVTFDFSPNLDALNVWKNHGDQMVPWAKLEDVELSELYSEVYN